MMTCQHNSSLFISKLPAFLYQRYCKSLTYPRFVHSDDKCYDSKFDNRFQSYDVPGVRSILRYWFNELYVPSVAGA